MSFEMKLEPGNVSTRREVRPKSYRLFIVLPAFNEEENLPALLKKIDDTCRDEDLDYRILVVDDGSVDDTRRIVTEYATRMPVLLHLHLVNQGLGLTIRDGLYQAMDLSADNDIIITMDADETHSPGLMLSMVRKILEGNDVVVASRYQPGSRVVGLTLDRVLISRLGSLLIRIVFPTPGVRDFTCGYRAYRAAALKLARLHYGESFVDQRGFQCVIDILLKMRRLPLIFGEVPMILRYDLKLGSSKMRLMKTAVDTLRLLLHRRCGR